MFAPGKTFINLGAGVSAGIYARFLFFKAPILSYKLAAQVEAYALPAAGSTNKIAKVYTINNLKLFGLINIFKELYNNTAYAPGTHLAVDGVPGSNYPLLNVDALNQLTKSPIFKANLYVSFPLGPFLGGYFGVYAFNAGVSYNFTFVSVGSALDVSPYNTSTFSQKYVNGVNQSYPSASETFIAQETVQNSPSVSNNVHIRFTARNSRWLFNEMELRPNLESCSRECSSAYFISGGESFCTTSTPLTINGLPRGASVSWIATPTGIVSINSPNASQTILTAVGNGLVTLTPNVTNVCAGVTQVSKTIHVGLPNISQLSIGGVTDNQVVCPNRPIALGINYINTPYRCGQIAGGITNAQWEVITPSSSAVISYNAGVAACDPTNNNAGVTITFPNLGYTYTAYVRAKAYNSCGWSSWFPAPSLRLQVNFNSTGCGGGGGGMLMLSPNPSTNSTTIEALETFSFIQIKVYDKLGLIRKQLNFPKGTKKTVLNTSDLPTDIYQIQAFDGTEWKTISLSKQ